MTSWVGGFVEGVQVVIGYVGIVQRAFQEVKTDIILDNIKLLDQTEGSLIKVISKGNDKWITFKDRIIMKIIPCRSIKISGTPSELQVYIEKIEGFAQYTFNIENLPDVNDLSDDD